MAESCPIPAERRRFRGEHGVASSAEAFSTRRSGHDERRIDREADKILRD